MVKSHANQRGSFLNSISHLGCIQNAAEDSGHIFIWSNEGQPGTFPLGWGKNGQQQKSST